MRRDTGVFRSEKDAASQGSLVSLRTLEGLRGKNGRCLVVSIDG